MAIVVGKNGAVRNMRLLRGHPLLDQAAMDAVRQWRYRPYLQNGEPVEVESTVEVTFVLNSP